MAKVFRSIGNLFNRRKTRQLACTLHESDPSHIHTDACFVNISQLSVVELFQSQGCSSCLLSIPTIDKAIGADTSLLLLTYDVTYWDSHAWKDTFGNAAWNARQRAYAARWGGKNVYTPQVVVDGLVDGVAFKDLDCVES